MSDGDGNLGGAPMRMELTAVFQEVPEGYIGWVEELPGAVTQAETLEDARSMLEEAVLLVLEGNRTLAREEAPEGALIREPLLIDREAA
jgi:predicted RNase H-like HicB family nuclease